MHNSAELFTFAERTADKNNSATASKCLYIRHKRRRNRRICLVICRVVGREVSHLFEKENDYGTNKETFHKLCLSARTDGTRHAEVHEPLSCATDELGSETRRYSRRMDDARYRLWWRGNLATVVEAE